MSVAGFSMAESVYYEEPYSVPGPCRTCCLRCPCPNLITTIVFLLGVVGFCVGVVLASDETVNLFLWNSTLREPLSDWLLYVKIGVAIATAVMVILSVLFVAMACLGTGATRKEFVCRFRTRAKGRCQTGMVLTITYVLLLLWMIVLLITLLPTFFFSIQAGGICRSARDEQNLQASNYYYECLDLRQWGLISYNLETTSWADPRLPSNAEENYFMCDQDLDRMCDSDVLLYYGVALAGVILVVIGLIHYVLNFSANYAKLRDRFKDGYVDKRTGTYLYRNPSMRGSKRSLAGTRASLRGSRASVRNGGLPTPSVASTTKMSGYKNGGMKSSREDLYMQDMKQTIMNGYGSNYGGASTYAASTYAGSNYGGSSNYSGSNINMPRSSGVPSYKDPPEAIDEIPQLKSAYMESFAGDPEESYSGEVYNEQPSQQRDRFASQASYEANVPVDPYVSANIDSEQYNSGYGKTGGYGDKITAQQAEAFNLDRPADYGPKVYGGNRRVVADNDFAAPASKGYMQDGYNGISEPQANRNGSSNGLGDSYKALQANETTARGRDEYFI